MKRLLARLRFSVRDLSLRTTIAAALIAGLAVPVGVSALVNLIERRAILMERLGDDHARIVEVLASGLQTPIWEIRPDAGRPLIEALMLDERVTSIAVSSPLVPRFLVDEAPQRRHGTTVSRESPVLRAGEEIGRVRVEMDTGRLESQIASQWVQTLVIGLVQLATGMVIISVLLRYKVLNPLQRLVGQSEALAAGSLDRPLKWRRMDELGMLGRSFEKMRRSLRDLFSDLEQRNRDLQDRESELANQASILRATLDNMTDGITLVDEELRLIAWNDRFLEIMGLPRDRVRQGVYVKDLAALDLAAGRFDPSEPQAGRAAILASFCSSRSYQPIRYRTADGRHIDVRRRPTPGGGFVSTFTDVTEQVEAQRKADETRLLLEAVMDAAPAMLHVKDRSLRYELVNRRFLECWGLKREEFLGRTSREVFAEDISRWVEGRDRKVLETGEALMFDEMTFARQDGPAMTVWTTKVPLMDAEGKVAHIVTVDLDISERKRAEEDRQRWAQLLHDAIESIPGGFAVYDAGRRLVVCNTAFARLYDALAEELVGLTAAEIIARALPLIETLDGRPPASVAQAVERYWSCGDPVEIHLRDGRWMLVHCQPTAEGGIVFLRTDITHLKRMEQALRDSEQRFRSIAEAHPVPMLISALREDRLVYVSPGMASLFGAPMAELITAPPQRFFADSADRYRVKTALLETGSVESFECVLRKADGSTFPAAITARRIDYLGMDAAVGSIIDLTAIKHAEQEIARHREALHQSEKLNALGSLLAGVAHELNNPLSIVVGRSIMLESETADPALRTRAAKIRLAAERCARIVKTFLAIARQHPPARAPVRLNGLIESAVDLMGYGLRTADIELILDLASDLPELSADADQLTQVFTNLIVNAQQALLEVPGPRRLRVTTRFDRSSNRVRLEFADTGPGVPEAIRPRIFEPFYTSKPVGVGTGIGLSFSYGVIQSHGGTIALESPESGGATFVITLPAAAPGAAVRDGVPSEGAGIEPQAILIVDDEPEIAEMLGDVLAREGHRIDIAVSGNDALGRIERQDYAVILSDLKMPDLDGPGLYARLRETHPQLLERLVFMTGDTLGMGASDFLAQSGRPLIEKPVIPEEVLRVLRRILAQSN